jgi:hypothetical protein
MFFVHNPLILCSFESHDEFYCIIRVKAPLYTQIGIGHLMKNQLTAFIDLIR